MHNVYLLHLSLATICYRVSNGKTAIPIVVTSHGRSIYGSPHRPHRLPRQKQQLRVMFMALPVVIGTAMIETLLQPVRCMAARVTMAAVVMVTSTPRVKGREGGRGRKGAREGIMKTGMRLRKRKSTGGAAMVLMMMGRVGQTLVSGYTT